MTDEVPDLEVRVMFADSGQGTLRQLPLNIGDRVTVLYEFSRESQELTFAGLPTPDDGETIHELVTGLVEYLYELVKSDELRDYLDNAEKENN